MTRDLLLTVGTSLFHSATWGPVGGAPGGPLESVDGYSAWLDKTGRLFDHPKERENDTTTRERLTEALEEDRSDVAIGRWIEILAPELRGAPRGGKAMRFSAELATLVKLFDRADPAEVADFPAFLAGYGRAFVLVDGTLEGDEQLEERRSTLAGKHLAAYLNHLAADRTDLAQIKKFAGLASADSGPLIRALGEVNEWLRDEAHRPLDLVVTGGYKLYGLYLASLVFGSRDGDHRLIYIHERGNRLAILDHDRLRVDEAATGIFAEPDHPGGGGG